MTGVFSSCMYTHQYDRAVWLAQILLKQYTVLNLQCIDSTDRSVLKLRTAFIAKRFPP